MLQTILIRDQVLHQRMMQERLRLEQLELLKPNAKQEGLSSSNHSNIPSSGSTALAAPTEEAPKANIRVTTDEPAAKRRKSDTDSKESSTPASSAKNASVVSAKKDTKWLSSLEKLKEYKKVHGDCIVPRGFAQDPRLASWVAEQRYVSTIMPGSHFRLLVTYS